MSLDSYSLHNKIKKNYQKFYILDVWATEGAVGEIWIVLSFRFLTSLAADIVAFLNKITRFTAAAAATISVSITGDATFSTF